MPGPTNASPKLAKKAKKAKKLPPKFDQVELTGIANEGVAQNRKSKKTQTAYAGHVRRAQAFAASFAGRNGKEELDDDAEEADEGLTDDNLHLALEGKPIESTPTAIRLFIASKCFGEAKKYGTATGIHAAMKDHYTTMYVAVPTVFSFPIDSFHATGTEIHTEDAGTMTIPRRYGLAILVILLRSPI